MTAANLTDKGVRGFAQALLIGTTIFLLAPVVLVVLLSFSNDEFIAFPTSSWGFRQYQALFSSEYWLDAIRVSVVIAAFSAVLSTVVAVLAVFAIFRTRLPGSRSLQFASITPLIIPVSAYGVALYGVFARFDLVATYPGVILAHSLLSIPIAILVLSAALEQIPADLERVAMSLGATQLRAWLGITLRLLSPAVGAAFIFSFLTSFDEAVLINFLGGGVLVTLPKGIFDSVRFGVDPLITAVATLLIALTVVLVAGAATLQRKHRI